MLFAARAFTGGSFPLQNVLEKAKNNNNFIKPRPLRTCLCDALCMTSIPQYDGWLKVKHLYDWVAAEPDVFIMEHYFYLKEELKSKKVIQSWVFGRHLLRNEWSEPLQRKCSTIFIAGGKSWSFQAKLRILELCLLHCIGSFPIFTNFSHEIGVYIIYTL